MAWVEGPAVVETYEQWKQRRSDGGLIEAWLQDGEYLVGQTSGKRVRMDGKWLNPFLRASEIAPGVPWIGSYKPESDLADGVYEQQLARFRQAGRGMKHPRRHISRWTRLKAKFLIRWHRRPESRLTRWHRDRMRQKYG